MLPFQPPFPNQNQVRGANNPSLNQPPSSTNPRPNQFGFNNTPPMMMPPMGGFQNPNALLTSLLAQQQLIQGLQNNIIAALSQQGVMPQFQNQQLNMLGGIQNPNLTALQQGGLLGRPPLNQNLNQMTGFSPNGFMLPQNPNFVPNSQLPVMSPGMTNPAFLGNGNPQVRPSISNSVGLETQIASQNLPRPILPSPVLNNQSSGRQWPQVRPSISSSVGLETQIVSQNLPRPILPSPVLNNQSSGRQWPQMNQNQAGQMNPNQAGQMNPNQAGQMNPIQVGQMNPNQAGQMNPNQAGQMNPNQAGQMNPNQAGQMNPNQVGQMNPNQAGGNNFSSNSSENVASNNFKTKFNGPYKRVPSNMSSGNAWKKEKPFPRIDGRGQQQRNGRNTKFSEITSSTSMVRKRPVAVVYDESELRQWREARKRNFPTRSNIEKKLTPSSDKKEDVDSDAKARRQQLKEILAKQAELGVPVAEIPPNYLLEPKLQTSRNLNAQTALNTHENTGYNKPNNKRRFRHENRNAKKQKFKNEEPSSYTPVVRKREPTLLRKLLNADIRRDKSQLLQAFRFMVLNSFFKNSPDKPLVFPKITAKDAPAAETAVVEEKELLLNDVKFVAASTGKDGDDEDIESDSDEIDDTSDVVCEAITEDFIVGDEKSEEGELTD